MIHPIELERIGCSVAGLSVCNTSQPPSSSHRDKSGGTLCFPSLRKTPSPSRSPHRTFPPRSLAARGRPSCPCPSWAGPLPPLLPGVIHFPAARGGTALFSCAAQTRRGRHRATAARLRREGGSGQGGCPRWAFLSCPVLSCPVPCRVLPAAVPTGPTARPRRRSMLTGRRGRAGSGREEPPARAGGSGSRGGGERTQEERARSVRRGQGAR